MDFIYNYIDQKNRNGIMNSFGNNGNFIMMLTNFLENKNG